MPHHIVYFIIGPTGTGKSAVAVQIAKSINESTQSLPYPLLSSIIPPNTTPVILQNVNDVKRIPASTSAVIINCDVMQMFSRGTLDVVTNKMFPEEMDGIPHLFMNFLDPLSGAPLVTDYSLSLPTNSLNSYLYIFLMIFKSFKEVGGTPKFSELDLIEALKEFELSSLPSKISIFQDVQIKNNSKKNENNNNYPYQIGNYVQDASFVISFLHRHGYTCIVCGGTLYYAQALMGTNELSPLSIKDNKYIIEKNIDNIKDNYIKKNLIKDNSNLQNKNDKETNNSDSPKNNLLWEELKRLDPDSAAKYHPNDHRRIKRCLIIMEEAKANGGDDRPVSLIRMEKTTTEGTRLRYMHVPFYEDFANKSTINRNDKNPTIDVSQEDNICITSTVLVCVDVSSLDWLKEQHRKRVIDSMIKRGMKKEVIDFYRLYYLSSLSNSDLSTLVDSSKINSSPRNDTINNNIFDKDKRSPSICGAIGFYEFLPFLKKNKNHDILSKEDFMAGVNKVIQDTIRYAKQQRRWMYNKLLTKYGPLFCDTCRCRVYKKGNQIDSVEASICSNFLHSRCYILKTDLVVKCIKDNKSISERLRIIADVITKSKQLQNLGEEYQLTLSLLSDNRFDKHENNYNGVVKRMSVYEGDYKINFDSKRARSLSCNQPKSSLSLLSSDNDENTEETFPKGKQLPKSPFHCNYCKKIYVGSHQIAAHLSSKGHRSYVCHERLVEKQRKLGREIPQKKKKNYTIDSNTKV